MPWMAAARWKGWISTMLKAWSRSRSPDSVTLWMVPLSVGGIGRGSAGARPTSETGSLSRGRINQE